jgi:hypothetical protein
VRGKSFARAAALCQVVGSARWGQHEMVALLLERGADPVKSGAPWATPLAWARRKRREAMARQLEARSSA